MKRFFDLLLCPGNIPALDGLRAFAIILVVFRHGFLAASEAGEAALYGQPLAALALNGWLGVDLFFVLSGFLISHHLIGAREKGSYRYKNYMAKRVLRTFPLYYAILLIAFSGIVPYSEPEESISLFALRKYLLFLQDYFGSAVLVPLWSLAVEEKFYLIAPLLVFLILKAPVKFAPAIAVFMALVSSYVRFRELGSLGDADYGEFFWQVRAPFHQCLDGIFLGMSVAFLIRCGRGKHESSLALKPKQAFYLSLIAVALVLTAVPFVEARLWTVATIATLTVSLLFAVMVWAVVSDESLSKGVLGGVLLRVIGKLSYALYLTHYLFSRVSLEFSGLFSEGQGLPAFWFSYIGLSVMSAILLHVLVERPFLMLKAKIT